MSYFNLESTRRWQPRSFIASTADTKALANFLSVPLTPKVLSSFGRVIRKSAENTC